jgi:hypothetical protein
MTAVIFDTADAPYLRWMDANPAGYVLNTGRRETSRLAVLHQAGCMHIAVFKGTKKPDPFTTQETIKVCAGDIETLRAWCRDNRPNRPDFSHVCRTCNPQTG